MALPSNSFTKTKILELAREFKRRRQFLGLTQSKLALYSNVSQSIITKLERGVIDPTYSTVLKIEQALTDRESFSNRLAKDVMTKKIISVSSRSKLVDALHLMREDDFSQVLVKTSTKYGYKLVGVLYEKHILDAIAQKVDITKTTVSSFLSDMPLIVPLSYSVKDLGSIFQNNKVLCVLVADSKRDIVGLITKSDLFFKE